MEENKNLVDLWKQLEMPFRTNNYNGDAGHGILGTQNMYSSPVCLVAVHSVNHYSGAGERNRKPVDINTGGLVRLLGSLTPVVTCYNNARCAEINPYLGVTAMDRELEQLVTEGGIRTVLDIHGARDNDFFDIAIGTGGHPATIAQRALIRFMVPRLTDAGYAVVINPPQYRGARPVTIVARHRHRPGVGVLQVELIRRMREPEKPEAIQLVRELASILKDLTDK